MVDLAIITVLDTCDRVIGDFELPVKITVSELMGKIADVLMAMDDERYAGLNVTGIQYRNSRLQDNDTLYNNGIWDGSIIKLIY